jgi:SAM-dependent methyltransferase
MEKIDQEEVAKKYNSIENVWEKEDKWHWITHNAISAFVLKISQAIPGWNDLKILNAGSCGYSYGLKEDNILHIDIAGEKLTHLKQSIIASVESIPLPDQSLDVILCVGSVINYCDPVKVLSEFTRLLKSGSHLILEFENSFTFELLGKSSFNKKATLVNTFYKGKEEKIWFFSESYIKQLAKLNGLELIKIERCHILSPLAYRILGDDTISAQYAQFDQICSCIPFLKKFSSNSIFLLKKI